MDAQDGAGSGAATGFGGQSKKRSALLYGGLIGAAVTPDGRCYVRKPNGRIRWVRC